jgi:hypothetical protein
MLRAKRNRDYFAIEERMALWLAAGLALGALGAVFVLVTLIGSAAAESLFGTIAAGAAGAGVMLAGLFLASQFYEPGMKVALDRRKGRVEIRRRGLFGRRRLVFPFEQVKYFRLIETSHKTDRPSWAIGLELRCGDLLTITSRSSHVEMFECRYLLEMNEFMRNAVKAPADRKRPVSARKPGPLRGDV